MHAASPPVFNCLLLVGPRDAAGQVTARAANLADIEGRGPTERAALAQAVEAFKAAVSRRHAAGEPIPWIDPPLAAAPGETPRWIAVHL